VASDEDVEILIESEWQGVPTRGNSKESKVYLIAVAVRLLGHGESSMAHS
jgi:hypothetical protein